MFTKYSNYKIKKKSISDLIKLRGVSMKYLNKKIEMNDQKDFKLIERYIKNPKLISKLTDEGYKELLKKIDDFLLVSKDLKKSKSIDIKLVNNCKKQALELKENAYIYRVNWNIYL